MALTDGSPHLGLHKLVFSRWVLTVYQNGQPLPADVNFCILDCHHPSNIATGCPLVERPRTRNRLPSSGCLGEVSCSKPCAQVTKSSVRSGPPKQHDVTLLTGISTFSNTQPENIYNTEYKQVNDGENGRKQL